MNILKAFKGIFHKKTGSYVGSYNISSLIGSITGGSVEDNMLVQSCVDTVATQMKKLEPRHILVNGTGESIPKDDAINRILQRPNPWMTTSDMIEQLVWMLLINFNAYVLPTYDDDGNLTGLWPIPGQSYEMVEDASGKTFLHVLFKDGTEWNLVYENVIHLRKHFSFNEFFGGNEQGMADIKGLQNALGLTNAAFNSLKGYFDGAGKVSVVLKQDTFLDETDKAEVLQNFQHLLSDSKSGVAVIGADTTFQEISRKPLNLNSQTMEFLEDRILRYFGVSHAILSGDFNFEQKEAFYDKTIEPLCVTFSQAFTKALFTMREQTSYGHRIFFYASRIDFMSNAQKIEMARILGDRGTLYENEIRSMFGLVPLDELKGVRMMSLNYINAMDAPLYQKQKYGIIDNDADDGTKEGATDDNDKPSDEE